MEWERFWKGLFSASVIYGLLTLLIIALIALKNANAEQFLDPQYTWTPRYYFFIKLIDNKTEPIRDANVHLTYDDRLFHTNENGSVYFEVPENITYYIIITKNNMDMIEIRDNPNTFYSTNFSPSYIYVSNLTYHDYLMTEVNKETDLKEVSFDLIIKIIIGISTASVFFGATFLYAWLIK